MSAARQPAVGVTAFAITLAVMLLVCPVARAALNAADAFKRVVVGPGFVEASDRQVVRTAGDVAYVIVADDTAQRRSTNPGPGVIHVYKADVPGIPTAFSEVDGANRPTSSGTNVLESPDSRLDRNGVVHVVYADNATNDLYYQTFSTVTDKWGPRTLLATNALTLHGGGVMRIGNAAIILDNNDVPHVAYTTTANTVAFLDDVGGVWTAPRTLSTGSVPVHPSIAADANGAFYLTWLDNSAAATSTIKFKYRAPNGTWGADQTVASSDVRSNNTLDQSPSIALNAQNTPYIIYLSGSDYQRIAYLASNGTWQHDDPTPNLYGHDSNVYLQGNDLYAFLGHDIYIHPSYQVQLAGQGWTPYQEVDNGVLDGSASVRWDPLRETDPNVIDYLYMNENTLGDRADLSTAYYMAVLPGAQGPPPPGVLLGDQYVESTHDANNGGTAEAFRAVAAASGTLSQLSVYVDATTTAGQVVVGVYANSGGHPGALLTQATIASPVKGAWNAVTVPSAPVNSGTIYWIAILAPGGSGTLAFRDLAGGGTAETSASSTLQILPATWTSGTVYTDGSLSAYAPAPADTTPPTASIKSSPSPAIAGQTIKFDASGSTVRAGGSIVDYKWDLDGSGQYATDTGTTPNVSRAFAAPGIYTVGLKVTDDAGLTATTTVPVKVLDMGVGSYADTVGGTAGLIDYYKLGEPVGPTIADSAGRSPGSVTGGTFGAPGAVAGDPTTAIGFNGTSDFGAIPLNLSGQERVTIEFWLKWNQFANNDRLAMEFTPNYNQNAGGLLIDPNCSGPASTFTVGFGSGATRNLVSFARPTAKTWHHYVFVFDTTQPAATQITPYVDGQAVSYTKSASATGAGFANSTLYLMSRAGTTLFGAGTLGQLAVYNKALSANTILGHYSAQGTNHPPTAVFGYSPSAPRAGQNVTFDASASTDSDGQIVDYKWDLDGSGRYATDTGFNPRLTTTFPSNGSYTVGLRVIDTGNASATASRTVIVGDMPPVAAFTTSSNPTLPVINRPVNFNGSSSSDAQGTIVDYRWDLDGSGNYATDTGTTPTASKTWTTPGSYRVGLRVTNDAGQTSTVTHTVNVKAGTYAGLVLATPGLVSFWRMGESSGSTLVDSAGSNSASAFNATLGLPGPLFGDPTTAVGFNGSASYVSAPLRLSTARQVTLEFWLNWNKFANDDHLALEFTPNYNTNAGGFIVDPDSNSPSNTFAVGIGMSGSRNIASFTRPSAGAWHYYAFVFDLTQPSATQITPYVDGQPVSYTKSLSGTGATFANSTLYMMSRAGTTLYSVGTLGDVAVYGAALSGSTIASHYSAGTP